MIARVHMCKTAVAVKFMLVQILKRIEPEVNQTGCEHKYKYQKQANQMQKQTSTWVSGSTGSAACGGEWGGPGGRESRNSGSGSPSLGDPLAPSSIKKESTWNRN